MPGVIDGGIGTWYYGKRRIHTVRGDCEVCRKQADLVSYDTTLFFVVAFLPLIPLQKRRVIRQCSNCKCHRVLSLRKWEEAKARDGAELMEKLQQDPNNRDTILHAIGYAQAYQDEPLFNRVVDTLAGERTDDAVIQVELGNAFSYFAHWARAEESYRAALAAEDSEAIREQLALTLLKQDRPDEARPYLQHIIDNKKRDCAGMFYYLIKGYQAQGRNDEALDLMDERDRAFPEFVQEKEYKAQRKISTRYQHTGRKVASAFLADAKAGYREGNWSSRIPLLIAAAVVLGLIGLYFGSAVWMGQSRKVYLVNGTNQPYTVLVQGVERLMPANYVFPIQVSEGDVEVVFQGPKLGLPPIRCQIETSFWSRPFEGHTFVINPDQSAIIVEEEIFYAVANPRQGSAKPQIGKPFYSMEDLDYEFVEFPPTLQLKGGAEVRKTRVALATDSSPEARLAFAQGLNPQEQVELCQRVLLLDPNSTRFLNWLAVLVGPNDMIAFLEPRLDDLPLRVEWHRLYQTQMERVHPETDLRPRYRKLLADSGGSADALYLLGRADPDLEEGGKLFRQAAVAARPSGYAFQALAYRAMCEGSFADAAMHLEKALPLMADKTYASEMYFNSLLAGGEFDRLQQALQKEPQVPLRSYQVNTRIIRLRAIRGDKAGARQKLAEVVQSYQPQHRVMVQKLLETELCCYENDLDCYLKATEGGVASFPSALLRGQLKQAADLANSKGGDSIAYRGLLYLAAVRANDKKLAESSWYDLLDVLKAEGRQEKIVAEILEGRKPLTPGVAQRVPIDPNAKRVLLAVLAQRYPDQSADLLALSRKLDFHHDAISLCLGKVLRK